MKTGYRVLDVMTNKPVTASKDMILQDAARLMEENNVNSLLIVESGKAIGIITDEDIVRKVVAKGLEPRKLRLKDLFVTELISITSDKDIYDALILMRDHAIRQLPVIDDDKLVGYLTLKDILKIEPELIDIIAEKYELREESRKLYEEPEDRLFSGLLKKIGIKKKSKKK
jgi:CBS domain-containing protein